MGVVVATPDQPRPLSTTGEELLASPAVRHADPRQYRADIDGLRAIAVVPVVLFHAHTPLMSGGFVGVDVFFVISGFLITRLLAADIAAGRFSVLQFYERRVRRIWPAFLAVLAATSIVAALLLMPAPLVEFAHSMLSSTVFASNILFFRDVDYWSAPAHTMPLLHTWSLSVEEQFYIVFPLLLWGLLKLDQRSSSATNSTAMKWRGLDLQVPRWSTLALSFLAVASLVACVAATSARGANESYRAAAFYLAPFRAWELLAGALIALEVLPPLRRRLWRELTATSGMLAIVVSVVAFDERTSFPGAAALLPVLGASLIIFAGQGGTSVVAQLLSMRPIVFVGHISYSLYLWHWPCLVFVGLWTAEPMTAVEAGTAVVASCGLAWLSWRFVEGPVRDRVVFGNRRSLFAGAAIGTAIVVAFGVVAHVGNGLPARLDDHVNRIARARTDTNPDRKRCHASDKRPIAVADACRYGAPDVPGLAIWGDSFAAELAVSLGQEAARRALGLLYISHSACPPALDVFADRPVCDRHNRDVVEALTSTPSVQAVVLVARYTAYDDTVGEAALLAGFGRIVDALVAGGKRVVIVYPIPEPWAPVPTLLATRALRGGDPHDLAIARDRFDAAVATVRSALDAIVARHGGRVVPALPERTLCHGQRCALMLDDDVLYFDGNHLSVRGAERVLPTLVQALEPWPRPRNPGSP
jgi:peptidoglycan/LPS O-acetylase OafA/YrhL